MEQNTRTAVLLRFYGPIRIDGLLVSLIAAGDVIKKNTVPPRRYRVMSYARLKRYLTLL